MSNGILAWKNKFFGHILLSFLISWSKVHLLLPVWYTCFIFQVGAMLKPFLPQLQTTFIKALNDPTRAVRMCAAKALQKLIKLHTRVDPLFTELHNGVKNTEDNTIRYNIYS